MNIIRICPVYYPYFKHGGSVVADYELDKAIVAEGHSITVVTCKENIKESSKKIISNRHKVIYFSCVGNIIYGIALGPLFQLLKMAFKQRKEIDIVWFGGVWNVLTIFGPLICRIYSIKYVITPHGMLIPHLIGLKSNLLKKFVIKLFLRHNLNKAFKVHFTVTKELEETILATKAKMNPIIFPLTFDLRKFDANPDFIGSKNDNEKITLSFIGRITPKKRIDLIFEGLKLLPDDIKEKLRFHIIGTDAEGIWDHQRYTKENIGIEICYFGPLYNSELINAYHEADIFVLCSESENFAISVVEAAYSYCALLISKEVGVSEYFSDKSAIFSNLEICNISKNIAFLVNHPHIIETYKLAARKVSEQFDSSSLSKHYFSDLLT